jgi:hypothetical protein
MFPRTKPRKALSTVIVTLIILVASVVLGTGVVLYGTSLFQTGAQSQAISVTGIKVWADKGGTGWAWGAADVRNSGDKLLSVNTISIRGTSIPFSNWYVDTNSTAVTNTNFQAALNYTSLGNEVPATADGGMLNNTSENSKIGTVTNCAVGPTNLILQLVNPPGAVNPTLCFNQATGPLSLQPGAKAIVYFKVPQNTLTSIDAGSSGTVAIYAGQVGAPETVTIASQ